MTKAWHDIPDLGVGLKKQFNRMALIGVKTKDSNKLINISNSMGHVSMQIVNLKNNSVTNERLDKIELILKNISPQIIQEALQKVEQRK